MRRLTTTRGKSGGALRHSTGLMKIQYMDKVLDFREELSNEQTREMQRKIEITQTLYCRLIELDPLGGEAWYDDNENVPERGLIDERITLLKMRIEELEKNV